MKISIITTTYNSSSSLQKCIDSLYNQTYLNKEHIIIDGKSSDNTIDIIKENSDKIDIWISEKDNGIYDAINKGIKLATGDVIGLLHSDDFFADENVLEKVAAAFAQSAERKAYSDSQNPPPTTNIPKPTTNIPQPTIDAVYSDLVYVKRQLGVGDSRLEADKEKTQNQKRTTNRLHSIPDTLYPIPYSIIRYWKAHKIKKESPYTLNSLAPTSYNLLPTTHLLNGWMPPHPTLFVRKEVFDKYSLYRTDMKIAADYEMILRLFWKHKITSHYLPNTTYCMTIGGASNKSLRNIFIKSREDYTAMKLHSLPYPFYTLLCKNLSKLPQFFKS